MKRSRSSVRVLAVAIKPFVATTSIAVLLCVSLGLIAVDRLHPEFSAKVRAAITDTAAPVVSVLAKPADAVSAAAGWMHEMSALRKDNVRLAADNARLQQWQAVAGELASENEQLRALLKFAPVAQRAYTSARVAADAGSPYSRSVIITSGSDQHVSEGLAVVNDAGLVGRVVDEVGRKTARVLLLTDMNSRIPVISEHSRERAIAGGNNSDLLSLIYLPENSKLKPGETILTSGDGGTLPPGLPVGIVVKIEKGVATVRPFVEGYHLEFVTVVDFSM